MGLNFSGKQNFKPRDWCRTIISAMVMVKGEPQIQDRFCHRGKEVIIGLNKLTIIA